MESFETGRLIYLILLLLMVAGWFFSQNRLNWNKTLQQAAVWGLIFLGAIAAYGLWADISRTVLPKQTVFAEQGRIEVPRSADGHYHLNTLVNGTPVEFILDTGASSIVLTQSDAQAVGLDPANLGYFSRAMTANGEVRTAPVRLAEVSLGPITDKNVAALVNEGEMRTSLMGMDYLQRWGKIEIAQGVLSLTR